ncbi:MAG: Plug domain-containing protein, partial [Bacteroidales bacterium]|nr:Plug domain-containing protein [Bacteroidales bacterium]
MKKFFCFALFFVALFGSATDIFCQDTLSQRRLDSIIVSVSRAGAKTPVANTTMSRDVLEKGPSTYSLPMMLNMMPSVVSTTEGGLALGYSNLRVRGSDASRTNVTLNG